MKVLPLTKGKETRISDEDFERVGKWKWRARRERSSGLWYAFRTSQVSGKKRDMSMARFILDAPKGIMTDHRDGDTLNNQRENLRLATNQQNQHNQRRLRRDNTTGFKGVTLWPRKGVYNAQIYVNTIRKSLGCYKTPEEAAAAYDAAAVKYFGEFAATNAEIRA